MAKKKAVRPARKKARSAGKKPARKRSAAAARRPARPARKAKKAARKAKPARARAARRAPAKKSAKRSAKKVARKAASKPSSFVRKAAPVLKAPAKAASPIAAALARASAGPRKPAAPMRKANLDRPRRTVAEIHGVPSSLDMDREASAVRTGRAELQQKLQEHTNTSPALTAGDVDADWGGAESSGDEAPGGDNPTPDQDVVEEIGRALGVEYDDDQELQGGEEIAERDRHRWELDPESSDDFEER